MIAWSIVSLVSVVIYWIASIPAYLTAYNRNSLYLIDVIAPLVQVGVWVSLGFLGWGERPGMMGGLIEIPLVLIVSFICLQVSVFAEGGNSFRTRKESLVLLATSIVVAILVRTFMPYIPYI